MERSDCVNALANIQTTLELMSKAAKDGWIAGQRRPSRWVTRNGETIDLAGTLDDCLKANEFRQVARWIEFRVDDGPARRDRLAGVLRALRDSILHIECGNPYDPFLWARESIDEAAAKVPGELGHVGDYIGQLVAMIESQADPKTDSRKKLPTSERVLRAIKFVNDFNKRVTQGKADGIPENKILSMHLDKPIEHKEVKNLARQLRNYRHLIR